MSKLSIQVGGIIQSLWKAGLSPIRPFMPSSSLWASSPFVRAKWTTWASDKATRRGAGKESLQWSLINFHLYFTQTKGNTTGWKMTSGKFVDNGPCWPALNFHGKCRNMMLLSQKPVLRRQWLSSFGNGKPAQEAEGLLRCNSHKAVWKWQLLIVPKYCLFNAFVSSGG